MSNMRFSKAPTAIAAGSVLLLVGLAGCTPEERVSVRASDAGLLFTVCNEQAADEIQVRTRPWDSWDEGDSVVWTATADRALIGSEPIVLFEAPAGFTNVVASEDVDSSDTQVQLIISTYEGETLDRARVATFDGRRISTRDWLTESGELNTDPC